MIIFELLFHFSPHYCRRHAIIISLFHYASIFAFIIISSLFSHFLSPPLFQRHFDIADIHADAALMR
jgi:hypothetical protein